VAVALIPAGGIGIGLLIGLTQKDDD